MAAALPAWAEAIRRKYLGGEASVFLLHRNVHDQVLHDGKLWLLEDFLARVLLWENKARILSYDAAAGLRFLKGGSESTQALLEARTGTEDPLAFLERQLTAQGGSAAILSYASTICPRGDDALMSTQDRTNAVRIHRWSQSEAIAAQDSVVFLLAESLVELHSKLVGNPRIAAVEVPLPNAEVRAAVIRQCDPAASAADVARLASHTAGLRAVQISQLLTPRESTGLNDVAREALIAELIGKGPDSAARAAKFSKLTQGMSENEIRHLINPDHAPAASNSDPYKEVLELIAVRKREIIEKECEGLIEFVDARYGLEAVGGNAAIKAELNAVAEAIKSGERARCPMGLLFVGAMGTGKTFVAKAFVHTSGLTAVTLKNFRSKWVGSTEANLEKVLGLIKALGPIILIIDEGDRSFGGSSDDGGDDGTSSRVIARLKEFMSEPDNRGVVLFILMTNRPDKLDLDIKRAGRLDRKIPFFYSQTVEEVEQILATLLKRYQLPALALAEQRAAVGEKLVGYSNADVEAIVLLGLSLASEAGRALDLTLLAQAVADYMPTRDTTMIEFMELQAVFEASRRSMLPEKYRNLTVEELQLRVRTLKAELRIR